MYLPWYVSGPGFIRTYVYMYLPWLPAQQTKLHVFYIPLEPNGEYTELGDYLAGSNFHDKWSDMIQIEWLVTFLDYLLDFCFVLFCFSVLLSFNI